ncbi:MAG: hypothetical protein JXQ90_07185 [Cyclobacteriaceae bacterium]
MNHSFFINLFSILFSLLALSALGQGSLIDYEHLESTSAQENTFLFESRMHRNPRHTYRLLLNTDSLKGKELVYLYQGHPILAYKDSAVVAIRDGLSYQPSYRLDLQLKPIYYAEYGHYDEPFRTQLAIGPRLQFNLRKGFYAVAQWIQPFQNDFDYRLGLGSRPGEIGVGYTLIRKGNHFFNTYLGTFRNRRYGGYASYIRMFGNNRMYAGAAIYYTGLYLLDAGTLYADPINYLTGYVHFTYRLPRYGLVARVQAEKYLRDDIGGKLTVFRQFGNTDIGFFASKSVAGDNAGFYVTFALWPRKFYANRWIQIRPPHSFKLNYDLRPNTGIGEQLRPYTDFYEDILRFNPDFVRDGLENNR